MSPPPNTTALVTSMSPEGYKLYGRNFLEGYSRFGKHTLWCYVEEKPLNYPQHKLIEYRNLFEVPGCLDYLHMLRDTNRSKLDWRRDLFKFCRKMFAQIHVLTSHRGKVFWMDSDVNLRKSVNIKEYEDLLEKYYIVYMGRRMPAGEYCHPCTSFVGWNTLATAHHEIFIRAYANVLDEEVFTLPEWHDAYVFDYVRRKTGVSSYDIAFSHRKAGAKYGNVFNDVCPFGRHKKGMKKYSHLSVQ